MDGLQEGNKAFINLSNHFKALRFSILGTIFMLVALCFLDFKPDAIKVFGIFWLALTLPSLYLHIEYLIINSGQSIQLDCDQLIITQGSKSVGFKFADMDKIILYKPASLDKGGIPLSPIESYHYARIFMKSNEEIIITSLLFPKVEKLVNLMGGVRRERRKRPFCSIFWK